LAIVRSVIDSLGGTVEVTSPGGDGRLTVFVARLPHVLRSEPVESRQ
jgi:signal transduction histidine kinase